MNRRVWIGLCLFFCAFNLKLLIDDYQLLIYAYVQEDDPRYNEIDHYWLCPTVYTIQENSERSYQEKEPKKVSTKQFLSKALESIEKKINRTGLFEVSESFVFKDLVCFPVNKSRLENDSNLELFFEHYAVMLFIHSSGKKLNYYDGFYLSSIGTKDRSYLAVQRWKVYDRNYLTSLDCSNVEGQLARSRFTCLNDCFRRLNLPLGVYPYSDKTHKFNLSLITNQQDRLIKQTNIKFNGSKNFLERMHKSYPACFHQCPQSDCFHENSNAVTIGKVYYDEVVSKRGDKKLKVLTNIFEPYFSTSSSEFFLQFFGLLTLFTNTSVISIVNFLVVSLARKLKLDDHRYFGIAFPKFKIFIFVLCLLVASVQSGLMIYEFCHKSAYPKQTTAMTFSSRFNPFSVVACFPVELLMDNTTEIRSGRNDELLRNHTVEELINQTSGVLDQKMIWANIYLGHKLRPFELKDKLSDRVLFRNMKCGNSTCLTRCFLFKIQLKETRLAAPLTLSRFGFLMFKHRSFTA